MNDNNTFIHFTQPQFGNEEKLEIIEALDSGWVTLGPRTKQFEEEFAKYVGAKYAVGVSSNTAGMHLSLLTAGINPGDEIITSPFTFVATLNVIVQVGAVPVLVDINPQTFNIDPEKIEEKITEKTKAIMPVHYGGLSVELDKIHEIAKKHNLIVIEDAAHATGASYKGKKIGVHSDFSIFSFHPIKNMSTGDGGMVTTNNEEYAAKLSMLRLHGMSRDAWKRHTAAGTWQYDIETPGFKYNMTDIAAALGIHQLRKLDRFIDVRKQYAKIYDEAFAKIPEITTPYIPQDQEHIYSLYTIKINTENLALTRNEIIDLLKKANIGVNVQFIPAHFFTFYSQTYGYKRGDYPNAEKVFEQIISIPLYPKMSLSQVNYVIETLKEIIETNRCEYSWKLDNFDTEIFGIATAKIKEISVNGDTIKTQKTITALQNDLKKNNIEYAVYRVPASNYALIQALEQNNFVTTDGLISLEMPISKTGEPKNIHIRRALDADRTVLETIAATSFDSTRVFNDSLLDKENASELYRRWVVNSLEGKVADEVLVYETNGEVQGFITLQKNGRIPLIAVKKEHRGKGIAKALVKAALAQFAEWGVKDSQIETQTANVPALRAYQSCGYKIVDSHVTLRWSSH